MTQADYPRYKWIHWTVRTGSLTIITHVALLAKSISSNQLNLVADH